MVSVYINKGLLWMRLSVLSALTVFITRVLTCVNQDRHHTKNTPPLMPPRLAVCAIILGPKQIPLLCRCRHLDLHNPSIVWLRVDLAWVVHQVVVCLHHLATHR